MKYGDLIAFEPIDSVKVLRDADDLSAARSDVDTLVISPALRKQLTDLILPNLDLDNAPDAKGILVVANYGTGKTHLMSVVSSVLEHEELLGHLASEEVREAAEPVAGRYAVIRAEIGATQMNLRDIITSELSEGLARLGVDFEFPDMATVTNTKRPLEAMMRAFEEVHGDKGLLFVLDEMLDYLAGRRDNELRVDLAVLREIGEICKSTRFRFIGGVQEAIFDNPRFASAADAVLRVKERFTQMRISREDIAHVVEQRLLRKTDQQKALISEHLRPFTPAYEGMAERFDDFVALFPVHPAFLKVFEQVTLVEKRKVLTTLSDEMRRVLEVDVPSDAPGLICYDTYRAQLESDPSNRSIPEVREVLDRAQVVRTRVERALPTSEYVTTATRIVDALAVHRLTTGEITAPIGPTIVELRDDLTLLPPGLPEMDAMFLETTVGSVVDEIVRTMSGQFITVNEANNQVYLDVYKDIDYDQKIDDRANSLDDIALDEAYFHALETVLEQRDTPYVAGYRIWSYELDWANRQVSRSGYLFMGAPNERSTAQPPRDFYVYFLQPYDPPDYDDEEKPDEVFFRLASPDDTFTTALRRYAGAVALERESSGQHRTVYSDKHQGYLKEMVTWLRAHMGDAVTIAYRGQERPLASWLAEAQGPRSSVKEQIDTAAASLLASHFEDRYPGYPAFPVKITQSNRADTVKQALISVATGRPNQLGNKVLIGLGLQDVEGNLINSGPFATQLLDQLAGGNGKAVNRDVLLNERDPGVHTWGPWHLEPCWLVVVAAALTQLGDLELGFSDGQVDALALDRLARMRLEELEAFGHIAPPKELPLTVLRDAVKLIGLPPGAVGARGANEALVQAVATNATGYATRIVNALGQVNTGVQLWGAEIIEHQEERAKRLRSFESLVSDLANRNTVGKLNRLDLDRGKLTEAKKGRETLLWVEAAITTTQHLSDVVAYLREADDVFGPTDPNHGDVTALRDDMLALFRTGEEPDTTKAASLKQDGERLRDLYRAAAVAAHERDRLDGAGDERKRVILEGEDYHTLSHLATLELLPGGKLSSLQQKLMSLRECKSFDPAKLGRSVTCPECGYRPQTESGPTAKAALVGIEQQLSTLRKEWTTALHDSISASEMVDQIKLLGPKDRQTVTSFADAGQLPSPVDGAFIDAVRQVLNRFEVRRLTPSEVWASIFPDASPVTINDLTMRFKRLVEDLTDKADPSRVRIVPTEENRE